MESLKMTIEDLCDRIRERIPSISPKEAHDFVDYLWYKHWEEEHTTLFYSDYIASLRTETLKRDLEEWADDACECAIEDAIQTKLARRAYDVKGL